MIAERNITTCNDTSASYDFHPRASSLGIPKEISHTVTFKNVANAECEFHLRSELTQK